ncbi:MAG: hypothetical protein AVDCRST_MAG51-1333, partial [uncultured Ramlibacter sp.]
ANRQASHRSEPLPELRRAQSLRDGSAARHRTGAAALLVHPGRLHPRCTRARARSGTRQGVHLQRLRGRPLL